MMGFFANIPCNPSLFILIQIGFYEASIPTIEFMMRWVQFLLNIHRLFFFSNMLETV